MSGEDPLGSGVKWFVLTLRRSKFLRRRGQSEVESAFGGASDGSSLTSEAAAASAAASLFRFFFFSAFAGLCILAMARI